MTDLENVPSIDEQIELAGAGLNRALGYLDYMTDMLTGLRNDYQGQIADAKGGDDFHATELAGLRYGATVSNLRNLDMVRQVVAAQLSLLGGGNNSHTSMLAALELSAREAESNNVAVTDQQ